jgi:AcrR family transcriptional regulator
VTETASSSAHGSTEKKRGRGRPRPADTDQAVLLATIELLTEGGLRAATVDAIARRSGSAKTTIYRRWPSRDALILDAMRVVVRGTRPQVSALHELDRTLGSTVRGSARNIRLLVEDRVFRAAFPMIAHELLSRTTLGERFLTDVFRPIRASLRETLQDEIARGEIRSDIDPDLAFDLVNGAMLYRMLVGEPIDEGVADAIAELVLTGASARGGHPASGAATTHHPGRQRA